MAIREGRWDCPSCGSTAIYGRHVECPACGKPRPGGIRFYLTDDAPALVDPERLAEARAGADWVCEHCGGSNRARARDCEGCGAARGSSPTQRVTEYGPGEVPRSGGWDPRHAAATPIPPARKGMGCCGCLGLGGGGLFILLFIIGLLNPPVGGEDLFPGVVTGKSWERTVALEERNVVAGEGWELPDSARSVRRERKIKEYEQVVDHYERVSREVAHHEQVADGTETRTREVSERVQTGTRTYVCGHRDMGNGYFEDIECSEPEYETRTRTERYEEPRYRTRTTYETVTENEPVYRKVPIRATYYRYRVPRWTRSRVLTEKGGANEPVWPRVTPTPREREAARTQSYQVTLRDGVRGETHVVSLPHGRWGRLRVGDRVALRVRDGAATVLPPDSLSRCRRWHMGKGGAPPDSLGCSPVPGA